MPEVTTPVPAPFVPVNQQTRPILEPNLFCHAFPADWDNSGEVRLLVSNASRAALRAIPAVEEHIREGIVAFDRISRKYWAIRHFPCFSDCFDCCCAAQAVAVSGPDAKFDWPEIEFPEDEEDEPEPEEDDEDEEDEE